MGLIGNVQLPPKKSLTYLSTNYRRDLMWRPLIRMFRRWMKKDALSIDLYEGIRLESTSRQGLLFCQALGLPEELSRLPRVQMAILLMVSSHRIVRRKRLNAEVLEIMRPFYNEIWPIYYKIFNETSNKQRLRFFNEVPIKMLWSKFVEACAEEIKQYMHSVRSDYFFSPQVFNSFIEDIRVTEMSYNLRILP